MTYGKKYRLTGKDNFPEHSKLTLKLLKNLINTGNYETRNDILNLISYLLNEPKCQPAEDWDKFLQQFNATRLQNYKSIVN